MKRFLIIISLIAFPVILLAGNVVPVEFWNGIHPHASTVNKFGRSINVDLSE